MDTKKIICDEDIFNAISDYGFNVSIDEGRLMIAELILKANAGFINSYTEEQFIGKFDLLKKNRRLNKKGREFVCRMFYKHSNLRPEAYQLIKNYRA